MSGKYDDNIGLFPNKNRSNDSQPVFRGAVTLSNELLGEMVKRVKAGQEAKLSCAAWVNEYQGGKRINVKLQPWQDQPEAKKAVGSDLLQEQAPLDDGIPF